MWMKRECMRKLLFDHMLRTIVVGGDLSSRPRAPGAPRLHGAATARGASRRASLARDRGFPEVADEQLLLCRRDPEAYARKMAAHEDIPLAYGDVKAVLACRREGASSTLRPPPRGGADTGYSADAVVAAPRAGPPERRPAPEGGGTEQEEGQCSSDRDQTPTSRSGRTLKRTKHFDQE